MNAASLGVGGVLMEGLTPAQLIVAQKPNKYARAGSWGEWYGYGGVGDYAPSHGNTPEVMQVAHEVRDGRYDGTPVEIIETREIHDLVIVGGGLAGLGAAWFFHRNKHKGQTCLILENHPIFGGEAKGNDFIVNGHHISGPQGSNNFVLPSVTAPETDWLQQNMRELTATFFDELKIPKEYDYQTWSERLKPLKFARENYSPMYKNDLGASVGHFFDGKTYGAKPQWILDLWNGNLDKAPFPESVRRDFKRWRNDTDKPYQGDDFMQWLDSMSYRDYIEKVMRLGPEVTNYADPYVASIFGLGCDATSAYYCFRQLMPGVRAFAPSGSKFPEQHAFPGGNSGFARYLVKAMIPEAIQGEYTFESILNGRVNFAALDSVNRPLKIRLGACVVRVEHEDTLERADHVVIDYVKSGRRYRVKARGVVMATGGWMNRYVVRDLPVEHKAAYEQFEYAPILTANVALTNWRFMYKLGVTACRWWDGFGFFCNLRRQMMVGDQRPPLDPNKPAVLTFYATFCNPELSVSQQGARGRAELLTTSFKEYEKHIREQMMRLFGSSGFDSRRDIAGIVLNRWGHAYLVPQPGFHFGLNGKPAPREVVKTRSGRIAFGHSELEGHQHWIGAVSHGIRAAHQVMKIL